MFGRKKQNLQDLILDKADVEIKDLPRFLGKELRNLSEELEKSQNGEEFDQILSKYRNMDRDLKKGADLEYRDFKNIIYNLKKSYRF